MLASSNQEAYQKEGKKRTEQWQYLSQTFSGTPGKDPSLETHIKQGRAV